MSLKLPAAIYDLSPDDRAARCRIGETACILDGQHFFVRCDLVLPIEGVGESFTFSVWSTLSSANFDLYQAHVACASRAGLGPFFGWLANDIPGFPAVDWIKCQVHPQPLGQSPRLELEPTDHPLSIAQRNGLDFELALDLARRTPGVVAVFDGQAGVRG